MDVDAAHARAAPRPGARSQSAEARETVALVAENCRWEHAGQGFFDGEVEPCINGRTVALGAYFGVDVDGIVEQLDDGGWNCEAENGSVRSSFDSTINVLEGLLAHERATGRPTAAARRRGEEYLLERSLFRRKTTGEPVRPSYLEFSYPPYWHYDVLRAPDYFRDADTRDGRLAEAIAVTRAPSTSRSRTVMGGPAAGTRCARCACCPGTTAGASRASGSWSRHRLVQAPPGP